MANENKSIIKEALLDLERIKEALESNTKEILSSVAKEEIDTMVRESLEENDDDYEEEDVDSDNVSIGGEEEEEEEIDSDSDTTNLDSFVGDEEETNTDDLGIDGLEDTTGEFEDTEETDEFDLDLTSASDEDVIAVYKKLSGDDEIEIVSNNEVKIKDPISGAEYQVKLGGGASTAENVETGSANEFESDFEDENIYEIELDIDNGEDLTEEVGGTANGKPRTATSDVTMGKETSAPNTGNIEGQTSGKDTETSGDNLDGGFDDDGQNGTGDAHHDHVMETDETNVDDETMDETKYVGGKVEKVATAHTNKKLQETVAKYNNLVDEANKLKKENAEFKVMLSKFKKMLGETVVFTTNLANVTKLFTEHSTTKEEKQNIIKRFDEEVQTIKESKKLYASLVQELSSKKPISESVEKKITTEVTSSKANLNESTAYVDASTQRIRDLINRVENPNK